MAGDIHQQIVSIKAKSQVLVERYRAIGQRLDKALQTIAELNGLIAEKDRRLAQLESEVRFLKNSVSLVPAAADVDETRLMISELVREIDKCIRDLSD